MSGCGTFGAAASDTSMDTGPGLGVGLTGRGMDGMAMSRCADPGRTPGSETDTVADLAIRKDWVALELLKFLPLEL